MKDKLLKSLEFLGLKKEEIKIYLCCLEFWNLAISSISRITKIGRVNCYHYVEKLVFKWYLISSKKSWTNIYSAEKPQIFLNKEKERLNLVENIMPDLMSISSNTPNKPNISFFEWEEWIKNIFNKLELLKDSEIVSFSNFSKLTDFFEDKDFLQKHFKSRLENNIKTRFISPRDDKSDNFVSSFFPKDFDKNLLEVFLISSQEFFFESEITIFDNHIAIINITKENPVWVIIENKSLYKTQKAIFDLAWLGATSFICG